MGQGVVDAVTAVRAPEPARLLHDEVHDTCASPDVLCVQELLSRDAQTFFDGVGKERFVARFRDHNRPSFRTATMRGSGLGIASRAPLLGPSVRPYAPRPVGWDKLARKGMLHAQVSLESGPVIDVLNTHLQSGYDDGAIAVRAVQLEDLGRALREVGSDDRPFIVCGDFNIDGLQAARAKAEYQRLARTMEGFEDLGAARDLTTFEPGPDGNTLAHQVEPFGPPQRIDYVFFRPAKTRGHRLAPTRVERIFDRPLASTGTEGRSYASDHFGLCASFEYEPE